MLIPTKSGSLGVPTNMNSFKLIIEVDGEQKTLIEWSMSLKTTHIPTLVEIDKETGEQGLVSESITFETIWKEPLRL